MALQGLRSCQARNEIIRQYQIFRHQIFFSAKNVWLCYEKNLPYVINSICSLDDIRLVDNKSQSIIFHTAYASFIFIL